MIELLDTAYEIARDMHEGQEHFFGEGSYYDMHLVPVSAIARRMGYGIAVQATAILHDVLEDAEATSGQLRESGMPEGVIHAIECATKRDGQSQDEYLDKVSQNPMAIVTKYCDSSFNLAWTILNSPDISDENFRDWSLEYQANLAFLRPLLTPNPGIS